MNRPQIIKTDSGEELVVLTRRDYDAMRARAGDEEAEDAMTERIIREAKSAAGVALPLSVWDEIDASPSPVRPLRQWRKLTQEDLAAKANISQGYLSEIETGKKIGDVTTLRAIATALGVGLDNVTHDVVLKRGRGRSRLDREQIDAVAFPMVDVASGKRVWAKVEIAYLEDLAKVRPDAQMNPIKLFEANREIIERIANARYASGMNPPVVT